MVNWIERLRPGDEVVLDKTTYGVEEYEIVTVARRTPSGRVVVTCTNRVGTAYERTYRPDGREHAADVYNRTRLLELTPELRQRIADILEHERLEMQIRQTNWTTLELPKLRAVVAILAAQEAPS